MSNTDINAFLMGSKRLETSLLNEARAESDPATLLDVQFSVMESQRREGVRMEKAQDFNDYIKRERENYFNILRSKSSAMRVERKRLFNNFVADYYSKRYGNRYGNRGTVSIWNAGGGYSHVNYRTFDWFQYFTEVNQFWRVKKERSSTSTYFHYLDLSRVARPEHFIELRRAGIQYKGDIHWGWFRVLDELQFDGQMDFFANMAILLRYAFPFVDEYETTPDAYYYFVAFAEEYPLPTPEMMDLAARKACKHNTEEYAADANRFIDMMAATNSDQQSGYDYYFEPPPPRKHVLGSDSNEEGQETTYGMPDFNPNYSDDRWWSNVEYWRSRGVPSNMAQTALYSNMDGFVAWGHATHPEWWWPRPRDGYAFVSKIGFILPQTFFYRGVRRVQTVYGFQQYIIRRQQMAAARARRRKKKRGGLGGFFRTMIGSGMDFAKGDIWKAGGKIAGGMLSLANPLRITQEIWSNNNILKDVWREAENFTGNFLSQVVTVSEITPRWIMGEPISEEELMMALDLGIKGVVIAASGGTAVAAVGVAASQLQRGSWGEDEMGSILLSVGEVAAIAYTADLGVEEAAGMFVKNQVTNMAKREVYRRSDLDETAFGVFAVELGAGAGRGVYDGAEWGDAVIAASDKAALAALAKESPELALIAVVAFEVGKHGADFFLPSDETLADAEDYFENFSWEKLGEDMRAFVKSIDKDDLKKIVGLTVMVAAGKVSGRDAMRFIGKTIAERQITRFYRNEPLNKNPNPRAAKMAQLQAQVNKVKREEALFQKIRQGHIPSPSELTQIVDSSSAKWVYGRIQDVIPSDAQGEAWNLTFDLGFPEWDGVKVPEWMKIGSTDVPDYLKIGSVPEWAQIGDVDPLTEEHKKKIGESWEKFKKKQIDKYAWNNVLSGYLHSLWPPGTPLRRPGDTSGEYKYIGPDGKVYIRRPLDFSYEHPMITAGRIPQRFSESEEAYMKAREKELQSARIAYKKLTGQDLPEGSLA